LNQIAELPFAWMANPVPALVYCGPQFNIKISILLAAVTGVLASSLQAINKHAVVRLTIVLMIFIVKVRLHLHFWISSASKNIIVKCFSM
jgi:hypothetical protein